MTTGIVSGHDLRIYIAGSTVAYATSCTFAATAEFQGIVHKDVPFGGWQDGTSGSKSATLSTSALVSFDGTGNKPFALFSLLSLGTSITWQFSTDEGGDTMLSGLGIVTSITINAPAGENATYDLEITVKGTPIASSIT